MPTRVPTGPPSGYPSQAGHEPIEIHVTDHQLDGWGDVSLYRRSRPQLMDYIAQYKGVTTSAATLVLSSASPCLLPTYEMSPTGACFSWLTTRSASGWVYTYKCTHKFCPTSPGITFTLLKSYERHIREPHSALPPMKKRLIDPIMRFNNTYTYIPPQVPGCGRKCPGWPPPPNCPFNQHM